MFGLFKLRLLIISCLKILGVLPYILCYEKITNLLDKIIYEDGKQQCSPKACLISPFEIRSKKLLIGQICCLLK